MTNQPNPEKKMKVKNQTVRQLIIAGCAIGLLAGCASTNVTSESEYQGFLPKPKQVLVYDFAVSPDEVDTGQRHRRRYRGPRQQSAARRIRNAPSDGRWPMLSPTTWSPVQALGLPASRASGPPPAGGNTLEIKGQFISINEGDQTERVVIGLGLGRTDVKTLTQVYEHRNGTNILVNQFGINAESGRQTRRGRNHGSRRGCRPPGGFRRGELGRGGGQRSVLGQCGR